MATGLILQPTYRVTRGRPVIQLYGRLARGPAFLVEDDRFRPYFFVRSSDDHLLAGEHGAETEAMDLRDLEGAPVTRVTVPTPGDVPPLRERLARRGASALEADVRFPYRYLMDYGIRGGVEIDGEPARSDGSLQVYENPSLRPARCDLPLRLLSLDIETTPDASEVFCTALVHADGEEVHLLSQTPVAGAHVHADEAALVRATAARIRELDPDVIVGWNVVDFDLRVLTARGAALGLRARDFSLGRAPGTTAFQEDRTFTRQGRADVPGRMVLDGASLVRDAIRLEDYRLDTVGRELLGRGKRIDSEVPDAAAEIQRMRRDDPEALVAYNLEDARLVLEILEREALVELTVERSLLTGMQLDRVGASIASFDLVYLPELRARGVVAPCVDADRKSALVAGGAVLDSVPGLFDNVAVFDFKSLYPSLIRTFDLDPLAFALAGQSPGEPAVEAPNGARFARSGAILPGIIERFMERREDAKRRNDRHADQAIKIMMNALFGVLAAASCRFFNAPIANAITLFGQQTLGWTRDAFEDEGVPVIYGDTDSVFAKLACAEHGAAAEREALGLRERIEERIRARIRDEYGVEPKLALELERVFDRFFMPRVRGGRGGSKKRYAGWSEDALEIVGLEAVRRDWPAVAKRLQKGMLVRLFRNEDVQAFAAEVAKSVVAGELDAELVYARRVRKGSLEDYRADAPHIQAARKAGTTGGSIVRYVITRAGPEPVVRGSALPADIDRRHYVDRVLRPVADAILDATGGSFGEVLGEPHQLPLFQ